MRVARGDMDDSWSSSSSSDARTATDFGDFGVWRDADPVPGQGADSYDIDYLRRKNTELKKELKLVQKIYEEQGRHVGVTNRHTELVYKSLPAIPYNPAWNFSPRGLEFTQLYFWIIRDALWMEQNGDAALGVGALCIALAALSLCIAAWLHRSTLTASQEFFHALARLLWVVGMFVWMKFAVYDTDGNEAGDVYTPKGAPGRFIGTCILVVGLVISFTVIVSRIVASKVVLKPDESIAVSQAVQMKPFEEPRLRARFYLLFSTFRDWEMAAMFIWIGKDTAASQQLAGWWVLFYVFCYIVTVFQLTVSLNTRRVLIDHLHYCSMALWLLGNFAFQWGHMYEKSGPSAKNDWEYMYPRHKTPEYVANYMGNVLVLIAFVPIGILYAVWISATAAGWIHYDPLEPVAWDVPAAELVRSYADRPPARSRRCCSVALSCCVQANPRLPIPSPVSRIFTTRKYRTPTPTPTASKRPGSHPTRTSTGRFDQVSKLRLGITARVTVERLLICQRGFEHRCLSVSHVSPPQW